MRGKDPDLSGRDSSPRQGGAQNDKNLSIATVSVKPLDIFSKCGEVTAEGNMPILISEEVRTWRGDLEAFDTFLRSREVRSRKQNLVRGLRTDQNRCELAIRQLELGLNCFEQFAKDSRLYAGDPEFIDRTLMDLRDTARLLERADWPDFFRLLEAFERAEIASRPLRLRIRLGQLTTRRFEKAPH